MRGHAIVLFSVLLLASLRVQAQPCPWLTEGTAAAALGGGSPAMEVKLDAKTEGLCRFTSRQGEVLSILEIQVASHPHPECPPESAPLQAVGAGATMCERDHAPGETRFIVDGRVRHWYFSTSLAIQTTTTASRTTERQRERTARIAEQVAGNLY